MRVRDFHPSRKVSKRPDEEFVLLLKGHFTTLTAYDLDLADYLKEGLSTKEIGLILNIAPESVKKSKYRLRKKLGMTPHTSFVEFFSMLA